MKILSVIILSLMVVSCGKDSNRKSAKFELVSSCPLPNIEDTVIATFYEKYEGLNDCYALKSRWEGKCIAYDPKLGLLTATRQLQCRRL